MNHPKKVASAQRNLLGYGAALLSSFLLLFLMTHFLSDAIRIPPYEGDTLWAQAYIKSLIHGEWWPFGVPHSSLQGYPFGYRQIEFPLAEGFLQILVKIVGLFSSDSGLVMNAFYVLGFPLSCLSFVALARQFQVDWMTAIALGLLYSVLPFHFERIGHLFLASYFFVPLYVLVLLWLWRKRPLFSGFRNFRDIRDRKTWLTLGICVLASGGGVYYAFFSASSALPWVAPTDARPRYFLLEKLQSSIE
jgi:phosphoglycerol transferase